MSGIVQGLIASLKSAAAAATDAYFNLVTLLLNTTTTNGAQNNTFLDSSSNNFTITRNGNTTQGTFTPFSQTGWSNYFGSGNYLTRAFTSTTDGMYLQGSTYTIEAWVYPLALSGTQYIYICNAANVASYGYNALYLSGTSAAFATRVSTSGTEYSRSGGTVANNQWFHIAVSVSSNVAKLFLNGTQIGADLTIAANTFTPTGAGIGQNQNGAAGGTNFNGYISNLRITQGAALYTGTFTPSTTPLTTSPLSGTVSFLTCQSNRFLDTSSNGYTLAITGTPSVQAFSPFAPTAAYSTTTVGGSGYFDGTGDSLSAPSSSAAFNFSGDYTVEFWMYTASRVSDSYLVRIFDSGNPTNGFSPFAFYFGTGPSLNFYSSSNGTSWNIINNQSIISTIAVNQWYHIALTRSGSGTNNTKIFVNGVQAYQYTDTTAFTRQNGFGVNSSAQTGTSGGFQGYIAGLRVLNGTGYTSISVPTSPPTAITNTQLLLSATNAGIFDAAAKNVLETVGNAQVSTTQAKFGTTSMYFDGTGDYLLLPVSKSLEFGSANWTIELWLYVPSLPSTRKELFYLNGNLSGYAAVSLHICTNNKLGLSFSESGGSWKVDDTTGVGSALTAGTWQYVALTRSGQNIQIYLDGIAQGAAYTTTAATTSLMTTYVTNAIASYGTTNFQLNGYMDELRITIGQARTVTSVPTAAFPTQ